MPDEENTEQNRPSIVTFKLVSFDFGCVCVAYSDKDGSFTGIGEG